MFDNKILKLMNNIGFVYKKTHSCINGEFIQEYNLYTLGTISHRILYNEKTNIFKILIDKKIHHIRCFEFEMLYKLNKIFVSHIRKNKIQKLYK